MDTTNTPPTPDILHAYEALLERATKLDNPYWAAFLASGAGPSLEVANARPRLSHETRMRLYVERDRLARQYAWAVPDPAALATVAMWLGPRAIELGAGTGYWASLLAQLGVDVKALDVAPPDKLPNEYHAPFLNGYPTERTRETFYPVMQANATDLHLLCHTEWAREEGGASLFLCWPPFDTPMAVQALKAYTGQRLVYIGEGRGGCTADDDFWHLLEEGWMVRDRAHLYRWPTVTDWIYVYDRFTPKSEKGEQA